VDISAERERELVVAVLEQKERWKLVKDFKPGKPFLNAKYYLRRVGEPLRTITVSTYSFRYLLEKGVIKLEEKEGEGREVYKLNDEI
jgi:tRNA splicing endonuclease